MFKQLHVKGTPIYFTDDFKHYFYSMLLIIQESFIIYNHYIFICKSNARDITLAFLYGYKGFLQIVALILAFSIRKVKVKGMDDAKYIAAAVYVTSIVTAVVLVSTYTLSNYINVNAVLFSTGFFLGTTIILILVFIPKVRNLRNTT